LSDFRAVLCNYKKVCVVSWRFNTCNLTSSSSSSFLSVLKTVAIRSKMVSLHNRYLTHSNCDEWKAGKSCGGRHWQSHPHSQDSLPSIYNHLINNETELRVKWQLQREVSVWCDFRVASKRLAADSVCTQRSGVACACVINGTNCMLASLRILNLQNLKHVILVAKSVKKLIFRFYLISDSSLFI
jgi:hypothetical protein